MVLLGVRFDNVYCKDALRACAVLSAGQRKAQVSFLNLDSLYKAVHDDEFRQALQFSDLVLPDGIGLKVAARLFGGRMKENCNGTDFCPLLMQVLAEEGRTLYLLGGKPGVAERTAEILKAKFPTIKIVGAHC